MSNPDLALLRLLQLFSPTAPTGAFSYSQGLEWAVECGWISNVADTHDWLSSQLAHHLQSLELPILLRLYQATEANDPDTFLYWSQILYASRETDELRQEEKHRSQALWLMLDKLPESTAWIELKQWKPALDSSQLASFALAANKWQISASSLLLAYCWSWLENSVAAAIKLIPLGQSQGQQLLHQLSPQISDSCQQAAKIADHQISSSTTAIAIASSLHETQYSRLFRS